MYFGKIFLTILFVFYGTTSARNECLLNVSVPDISFNQANVSWSYNCNPNSLLSFKIYYDHVEYKACDQETNLIKKHKKKRKKIGSLKRSTIIEDLEPYSLYKFEVTAITKGENPTVESLTAEKVTEESLPQVLLKDLTEKEQADPDRITYKWEAPASQDCDNYNSELGYIFYKINGSSDWNKDYFKEDNLSVSTTDLTISSLLPFSLYHLHLYVTNSQGQFNTDTVLQVEQRTGPGHPHQPRNLTVASSLTAYSLQWVTPHPPTGHLAGYKIRWKQSNDAAESDWEVSDHLTVDEVSCSDSLARTACYQVEGLESYKNFSFQVMAFNKAVSGGSPWSDTAFNLDTETDSDNSMYMVVMVVIMVTVVVLLLLLVGYIMHRCNIRNRLKGFKRTMTDDYSFRPIIRDSESRLSNVSRVSQPRKAATAAASSSSPTIIAVNNSNLHSPGSSSPSSDVEPRNLLPSLNRSSLNRRSCLDPLPPVPGKEEPVYDEIRRPDTQPLDEDNYLTPNPVRVASVESLDEEGYLRPNFHRFQLVDTKSPDKESLPPIPIVSYSSQDMLETGHK
eukprot:GFUD01029336.1.p1 GENE.GFUD01029336.1~~GFUD01029336.1.p1  ORF type:complete len:564 (-),score=187.84 GFUD01029336.1:231-1922(-)